MDRHKKGPLYRQHFISIWSCSTYHYFDLFFYIHNSENSRGDMLGIVESIFIATQRSVTGVKSILEDEEKFGREQKGY
jgi:hypothetical protein